MVYSSCRNRQKTGVRYNQEDGMERLLTESINHSINLLELLLLMQIYDDPFFFLDEVRLAYNMGGTHSATVVERVACASTPTSTTAA